MRSTAWKSLALAALPLSLLAPAPGCGGKDAAPNPVESKSGSGTTANNVSTSGGSVASEDGRLELSIPASALAQNQTITITGVATLPGSVGLAYDVEPANLAFAAPVTLVWHYDGLTGASPSSLRIGTYVNGMWQALTGYALDANAQTVTATVKHLGSFGGTQQAQVCIAITGNACTQALSGGSSSGSSSGGGSSTSGSGGFASSSGSSSSGGAAAANPNPSCVVPSCEALDPCAAYPTANSTSCAIDPQGNYVATCCYDPNVPYCWSFGGGGCGGGGSSTGGSSGGGSSGGSSSGGSTSSSGGFSSSSSSGSASPGSSTSSSGSSSGGAPTSPPSSCGDSLSCGSVTCGDPNATVSSCTDSSGPNYASFSATCCYPPGVMPDNPSGSSSSSGSSSGGGSSSGSSAADAGAPTNSGGSDNGAPPGTSSSSSGG